MENAKTIVALFIVFFLLLVGCSSNDRNPTNIKSTESESYTLDSTNPPKVSYVKQGFYAPSEAQSEEIISAVINDRSVWRKGLDDNDIYFMEFADLNFDGTPEFIVCDTLHEDDAQFHSNAYYLKDGHLKKADVIDVINPMDGYDNYYTAYFDKTNGEYVIIGYNTTNHSEDLIYKLHFDGETITIEHLLNKTSQKTQSGFQYEYYKFEEETAIKIDEEEYNHILSDLEENDDWAKLFFSPVSDNNIKYYEYNSAPNEEKEWLLQTALSKLTYDLYIQVQ